MAQPEFDGEGKGRAVMIFGSDGSKWIAALIDALGHLQIDVVASGLPGGAAEEATLAAILAQLDVDLSTRAKESGGNLAAINAALDVALSTRAKESGGHLASILTRIIEAPPVPLNPICDITIGSVVPNTTWTEITAYTVTANRTFHLTDFYASGGDPSAGFEFMYNLQVGGADKIHGRQATGQNTGDHLTSPVVVGAGVEVRIRVYHWAGGNKSFHGTLIGFEV